MLHLTAYRHQLASFLLAFITMSGLSYINFLPGVVSALACGIGFSDVQAGQIVALNGYGALFGTTLAIFLVRHIRFRPVLVVSLLLLASMDIATIWLDDFSLLLGWRFFAGVSGGLALGLGVALLARQHHPDRAFGALLFVQFSIGSLVIYLLPALEAMVNAHAVFYVMASLSLLGLLFLLVLPRQHLQPEPSRSGAVTLGNIRPRAYLHVLLLLMAMVGYQIAASAIWAYVGLIGAGAGMAIETVSTTIALTGMLGLLGALLPIALGNRYGRLNWLIAGSLLSITAAILLNFSEQGALYALALALLFISWPAVQSFLLAATTALDNTGRLATLAAVVSSVGLATGPLLASTVIAYSDFPLMLCLCALLFFLSFVLLFRPVQATEAPSAALVPSP